MKSTYLIVIAIISFLVFSCEEKVVKEKNTIPQNVENLEPIVDFNQIESDYMKWWSYHFYNMSLSSNFIALNQQSDTITKKEFLENLITTRFIPLKIQSSAEENIYKLFELSSSADGNIGTTIKNEALTNLKYFKMEGLSLPEFNFTDLEGNIYTKENLNGKTLILKTWFINCKACVAEFPELNELIEKNKGRNDIVFLSLATDTVIELKHFLKQKEFKYKVIANQKDFIVKKLNLQIYPTHLVVDKNGIILKVVNKASEMIAFLENEKKPIEKYKAVNIR